MSRHQFGYDLPPGVSVKDIEDAQESIEDEEIESIRIAIRARQRQIADLERRLRELGVDPD
jgi:hypothetical protein